MSLGILVFGQSNNLANTLNKLHNMLFPTWTTKHQKYIGILILQTCVFNQRAQVEVVQQCSDRGIQVEGSASLNCLLFF